MRVNTKQRVILIAAAILAAYIVLFPPFIYERGTGGISMSAGNAFVYSPPGEKDLKITTSFSRNVFKAKVDVPLLFTQLVALSLITCSLVIGFKDSE